MRKPYHSYLGHPSCMAAVRRRSCSTKQDRGTVKVIKGTLPLCHCLHIHIKVHSAAEASQFAWPKIYFCQSVSLLRLEKKKLRGKHLREPGRWTPDACGDDGVGGDGSQKGRTRSTSRMFKNISGICSDPGCHNVRSILFRQLSDTYESNPAHVGSYKMRATYVLHTC